MPRAGEDRAVANLIGLHCKSEVEKLDLSSLSSVRNFTERMGAQPPTLDLLINNPGVVWTPPGKNPLRRAPVGA